MKWVSAKIVLNIMHCARAPNPMLTSLTVSLLLAPSNERAKVSVCRGHFLPAASAASHALWLHIYTYIIYTKGYPGHFEQLN